MCFLPYIRNTHIYSACMYVCMYVLYVLYVLFVCVNANMSVWVYVFDSISLSECVTVQMYVCMYVFYCMYACMYLFDCMYVNV